MSVRREWANRVFNERRKDAKETCQLDCEWGMRLDEEMKSKDLLPTAWETSGYDEEKNLLSACSTFSLDLFSVVSSMLLFSCYPLMRGQISSFVVVVVILPLMKTEKLATCYCCCDAMLLL